MNSSFTITWENNTIRVTTEDKVQYALEFENGETKVLQDTSNGWHYIVAGMKHQDKVESELMDEESSLELGRELEAEAIGKLIYQKEWDAAS